MINKSILSWYQSNLATNRQNAGPAKHPVLILRCQTSNVSANWQNACAAETVSVNAKMLYTGCISLLHMSANNQIEPADKQCLGC